MAESSKRFFGMRMDRELYERLERIAKQGNRPMTWQVNDMLRKGVEAIEASRDTREGRERQQA